MPLRATEKTAAGPAPGEPVPTPYPYAEAPPFPTSIGIGPRGMPAHACMGLNSCKASDRFGVAGPSTQAPNECAGQGYCSTAADHTCHVQNSCRDQGGCGLYGTAEELNRPGDNACRSQGSCATRQRRAIQHQRTQSAPEVWLRARAVFSDMAAMRAELLTKQASGGLDANQPLPETPGPPPASFAETGPTYLWIADDNDARGNMTACGSSGMSGAGGCS